MTDLKLKKHTTLYLGNMETTQEKKVYILDGLKKLAYDAHRGTSFDPDKRGQQIIEGYSDELENDLKSIPEADQPRYIEKYKSLLSHYLSARGRVVSPMISGPSNFPVRRMEKYGRWEDNAYKKFREWRDKAKSAIEKKRLANRSQEEVVNDTWNRMKKGIASSAATILSIDLGESFYTRALFVKSITGTINTFAKNGETELVKLALAYVKELNEWAIQKGGKEIISAKNSIWDLEQVAEVEREKKVDVAVQKNEVQEFNFPNSTGTVELIKNFAIERVQIVFPGKPSEEIREQLKDRAFRWAPSEGAWQRQLTGNGLYAAEQVIKYLSQIETNEVGKMAEHG